MRSNFFTLLCTMVLILTAGAAGAAEKKWEMSLTTGYNDKHPTVINVWFPWAEAINKETGGRVTIQNFNPGTICPEPEMFSSAESGVVTIAGTGQSRTPGKFPYAEVVDLPLLTSNAEAGSLLSQAGYEHFKALQDEEKGLKVLWQWASAPFVLHTKKPVRSLEDLKGMKIIGWYPTIMDVIRALGASPIQVATTDTYLSLQRGMADGVLCPLAPVRSFKINEGTSYTTLCNLMVSNFVMGMNRDVWNSLPDDIKAVFNKYSGEKMARWSGQSLDQGAAADREILAKAGHTFIELDAKELDRWRAAVTPIHEAWVKKMEGKGLNEARAILDWHKEMGKKYAEEVAKK